MRSRLDDHAPADADDTLVLPDAPPPATRPSVPVLASLVPVIGAIGLWLATGSLLTLWFAALGPVIAVAGYADAARSSRRERRRREAEAAAARDRVGAQVERRRDEERRRRRARHPDVAGFAADPREIWRPVPGRGEALVVGSGEVASGLRVRGGTGDAAATGVRVRAATLDRAPVLVDWRGGLAVTGPPVLAAAVLRGLILQLLLTHPPDAVRVVGRPSAETEWLDAAPHRHSSAPAALTVVASGDQVPSGAVVFARVGEDEPLPPGCAVVLTVTGVNRARLDADGESTSVTVTAVSAPQAAAAIATLTERARSRDTSSRPPAPIALSRLLKEAPAAHARALPAVIGWDGAEPVVVDLVGDGPHAIVAGVTGAGKSELLITWVTALCASHTTSALTVLLADFKGGTAFDALAQLPHVSGVLTDLDGAGARRAVESLRSEIRRRERHLADAGVRDAGDSVDLPRLVIVVDEFAALVEAHPDLYAVFVDVAARGRALGMHLILGTQRSSGVVRDALLANCPLRISLRVTDAADSRALLGTGQAADLPGDAGSRGLAYLRRGADAAPRLVRIALTAAEDVSAAAARGGPPSRRPWLPDLPTRLTLRRLREHCESHAPGDVLLGLADEPERQRQRVAVLAAGERGLMVVGGPGTGKTELLRSVAAQCGPGSAVTVPASPEEAWDVLAHLADQPPAPGAVVVVDDLDALTGRFPPEYAQIVAERIERIVREAGAYGARVVVTAQRLTGAAARIADLLPRRALLAVPSRAEHLAAGGESAHYARDAPAGRARLDGVAVQFALADGLHPADNGGDATGTASAPRWRPGIRPTGLVLRPGAAARELLAECERAGAQVIAVDETIAVDVALAAGAPAVVWGTAEAWQRQWRALAALRDEHDLVVDAACAAELRVLTGVRELPPYCAPGRSRGWLLRAGATPDRVSLREERGSTLPT